MVENVICRVLPRQISERKLLLFTGLFCFIFSSLADNITATLVSTALILSLNLNLKKRVRFITLAVFAVNSGGVALITGDVTTLMIFLANKVEILTLLTLSAPAFAGVLLFALSVMFLISRLMSDDTDLDPILEYIRAIEFETLLFFLGILLLVGMLKEIQALTSLVAIYDLMPPLVANYLMGIFSAFIDNVPLTAALLKAGINMSAAEWMGRTYAVGVGGSLLVIGSAAGIVAMSKIPGLTFASYLRYFTRLLIAYTFGYAGVFLLGHLII